MTTLSRARVAAGMVAGAGIIVAASLQAQLAASSWARVPALPTACYVSQEPDDF